MWTLMLNDSFSLRDEEKAAFNFLMCTNGQERQTSEDLLKLLWNVVL